MEAIKYQFYPSLLDDFINYTRSDKRYEDWNISRCTIDEFSAEMEQRLIDRINRVPLTEDIEAMERGIAFNGLVDMVLPDLGGAALERVLNINSNITGVTTRIGEGAYEGYVVEHISRLGVKHTFEFDCGLVNGIASQLRGATPQPEIEGFIDTRFGRVRLYGFGDYVLRNKVVDLKTTRRYTFGQYKEGMQQYIYPYCLIQSGVFVDTFEYLATDFNSTYTESYDYNSSYAEGYIREVCEDFIEYLALRRSIITDKKIFNL